MMKLTKNIRISLYILIPIILWMASGLFKNEKMIENEKKSELFSVQTILSNAIEYQPLIKLKAIKDFFILISQPPIIIFKPNNIILTYI